VLGRESGAAEQQRGHDDVEHPREHLRLTPLHVSGCAGRRSPQL
jgi:hypothetical protein